MNFRRSLSSRRLPILLVAAAVVLALPSVWSGWQQDDLTMRYFLLGYPDFSGKVPAPSDLFSFVDGDSSRTLGLMDIGVTPWWTLKTLRISFWRPLSSLTHWLDYRLWPGSSVMMHIQSVMWFGLMVGVVALLYRRFMVQAWAAGLAGLFFALDDAHGLAAGWISNRNALLAAVFGAMAIVAHDRWRREQWRAGSVVGPILLVLGLLSGESALAVTGYLFAYAVFLDPGKPAERVLTLVPYAALSVAWLVVHRFLGYGTWGSEFYVDPLAEPVGFLGAVSWKGPLLLADLWALPPSALTVLLPEGAVRVLVLWGVVVMLSVALLLVPLLRRDRLARFWCTGMMLSVPLVCSTMPHGRLLTFAGIGAFGLLAQWIGGVRDKAAWLPDAKWWRKAAQVMVGVFLVIHVAIAALILPFNTLGATFSQPYIQDAAERVQAGPEFAGQDLVIVTHPIVFYGHYFQTARVLAGQSAPRRVRVLAPGTVPVLVSRPDERTLLVRPEGGFLGQPFDGVFRSRAHPMRTGERVVLTGVEIEVTALTADGRPGEIAVRFAVPLEDGSLRWLRWGERGGFEEFRPPAVGESMVVQATKVQF